MAAEVSEIRELLASAMLPGAAEGADAEEDSEDEDAEEDVPIRKIPTSEAQQLW